MRDTYYASNGFDGFLHWVGTNQAQFALTAMGFLLAFAGLVMAAPWLAERADRAARRVGRAVGMWLALWWVDNTSSDAQWTNHTSVGLSILDHEPEPVEAPGEDTEDAEDSVPAPFDPLTSPLTPDAAAPLHDQLADNVGDLTWDPSFTGAWRAIDVQAAPDPGPDYTTHALGGPVRRLLDRAGV